MRKNRHTFGSNMEGTNVGARDVGGRRMRMRRRRTTTTKRWWWVQVDNIELPAFSSCNCHRRHTFKVGGTFLMEKATVLHSQHMRHMHTWSCFLCADSLLEARIAHRFHRPSLPTPHTSKVAYLPKSVLLRGGKVASTPW